MMVKRTWLKRCVACLLDVLLVNTLWMPASMAYAQNETLADEDVLYDANLTASLDGLNLTEELGNETSEELYEPAAEDDIADTQSSNETESASVEDSNVSVQQDPSDPEEKATVDPTNTSDGDAVQETPQPVVTMRGRGHNSGLSWEAWKASSVGEVMRLGTIGKSAALKGLKLKIKDTVYTGGVQYQVYTPQYGWLSYCKDGALAAVKGKPARIEAFRASLTGKLKKQYDLWYRVYVSGLGWLSWASNKKVAGTKGFSRQVEAIEFAVTKKGAAQPAGSSTYGVAFASYQPKMISSRAYIKTSWVAYKKSPKVSGSPKRSLAMKALQATINEKGSLPGALSYRIYAGGAWTSWCENDQVVGNKKNGIEAIGFKLTGAYKKLYDIYYRVHVSHEGWLGWAKNGQAAGSKTAKKGLDGFQIKLVPKGEEAPGSTKNHFVKKSFFLDDMSKRALNYSSATGWLIMIDNGSSRVGIYQGSKGNWKRVKYCWASCGKSSTPTVKGEFTVGDKGYVFGDGYSCYYWTQIYGAYLFHSVLYHPGTFNIMDGTLGHNVSHGCVRLAIENARYIQEHVPSGSKIVSY